MLGEGREVVLPFQNHMGYRHHLSTTSKVDDPTIRYSSLTHPTLSLTTALKHLSRFFLFFLSLCYYNH